MPIQPIAEDVIMQLNRVSFDLASLSFTLGAFSATFEYETEPRYSYDIYQVVESASYLNKKIADLVSKMKG